MNFLLAHTFKIKKDRSEKKNDRIVSRDIAKSLKMSFGFNFVTLRAIGIDSRYTPFIQKKKTQYIIFSRSCILVLQKFCGPTDGHTFSKKFSFFFLIKNIYIYLYPSRLFLKFHHSVTKVSITFFTNRYEDKYIILFMYGIYKRNAHHFT